MTTMRPRSTAERLGRWVGGWTRAYVHRERQAIGWLVAKGWPLTGARVLVWVVKVAILLLLLYVGIWLAILALLFGFAAWGARAADIEAVNDGTEWRYGYSGYGLYRGDTRIDIGYLYEED